MTAEIQKNEKTMVTLSAKMEALEEMNDKVKKDIQKYKHLEKDKNEMENNVKQYVNKYEGEAKNIKSAILHESRNFHKSIRDKTHRVKKLYKEVVDAYSHLQTEVDLTKDKLSDIKKIELEKFKEMKKSMVLGNIRVKDKLDVNGVAFINKVNADSVDFGNLRIDSNHLVFNNEASKIMIGDEVITAKNMFDVMNTMKYLKDKCGDKMEKCEAMSEDLIKEQEKKEVGILEQLQALRESTDKFLAKRRKNN